MFYLFLSCNCSLVCLPLANAYCLGYPRLKLGEFNFFLGLFSSVWVAKVLDAEENNSPQQIRLTLKVLM